MYSGGFAFYPERGDKPHGRVDSEGAYAYLYLSPEPYGRPDVWVATQSAAYLRELAKLATDFADKLDALAPVSWQDCAACGVSADACAGLRPSFCCTACRQSTQTHTQPVPVGGAS